MAKRAPSDEGPYRPLLDPGVISAALVKTGAVSSQPRGDAQSLPPARLIEIARPEASRSTPADVAEPTVTRVAAGEGKRPVAPQPLMEKFDQEKRILLTRTEAAALERLVNALAARLNSQVKLSHVLRSLITLLLNAESQVDKRAGETPGLIRPPNGDGKALQRFEKEIAQIVGNAIRDAGPLRP